jgi:ubiquinone biosynthesis protein
MLKTLAVASRDRARLIEIAQVVSRFGLDAVLARLGLSSIGVGEGDAADGQSLPQRTRIALEELGPTFVKLGQILATRGDLLPPVWIVELEKPGVDLALRGSPPRG